MNTNYKVYPGVNSFYVQIEENKLLSELGDFLNNDPKIEVTELRWSTTTKIGTVILNCQKNVNRKLEYIRELVSIFYSKIYEQSTKVN